MEKSDKVIEGIVVSVVVILFSTLFWGAYQSRLLFDEAQRKLEAEGFEILNSHIQTPNVIVILDTYEEFVGRCRGEKATTIYREGYAFYVFSEDWEVGYKWYGG